MSTPETISLITQVISSLGFPIFVACFMLYKGSSDTTKMQEAINELRRAIDKLTSEFNHHHNKGGDEE